MKTYNANKEQLFLPIWVIVVHVCVAFKSASGWKVL